MPRKQRFKPSRKPKPVPQNEGATPQNGDAWIGGHPADHDGAHQTRAIVHDSPPGDSPGEAGLDQRSH
jgi:hypothetical protein